MKPWRARKSHDGLSTPGMVERRLVMEDTRIVETRSLSIQGSMRCLDACFSPMEGCWDGILTLNIASRVREARRAERVERGASHQAGVNPAEERFRIK